MIGSSIVGVSKDSLPLRAVGEGRRLLRALAQNCDLLSELSEGEDMGKDVRNQIAQTTFELAKVRVLTPSYASLLRLTLPVVLLSAEPQESARPLKRLPSCVAPNNSLIAS